MQPEECVAARALMIHLRLCVVSVVLSKSQQPQTVIEALDNELLQPSNEKLLLLLACYIS